MGVQQPICNFDEYGQRVKCGGAVRARNIFCDWTSRRALTDRGMRHVWPPLAVARHTPATLADKYSGCSSEFSWKALPLGPTFNQCRVEWEGQTNVSVPSVFDCVTELSRAVLKVDTFVQGAPPGSPGRRCHSHTFFKFLLGG